MVFLNVKAIFLGQSFLVFPVLSKLVTGHYPTSQTEFEAFLKNINYFSAVPVNPFWADTQHPEKGWLWNPTLQTVEPVR